MRDIRSMFDELEVAHLNFEGSYRDASGRLVRCFWLDRYHTEVLVTGYDVKRHEMPYQAQEPKAQICALGFELQANEFDTQGASRLGSKWAESAQCEPVQAIAFSSI